MFFEPFPVVLYVVKHWISLIRVVSGRDVAARDGLIPLKHPDTNPMLCRIDWLWCKHRRWLGWQLQFRTHIPFLWLLRTLVVPGLWRGWCRLVMYRHWQVAVAAKSSFRHSDCLSWWPVGCFRSSKWRCLSVRIHRKVFFFEEKLSAYLICSEWLRHI